MSLRKYRARRQSRRGQPAAGEDDEQPTAELEDVGGHEHAYDSGGDSDPDGASPEQATKDQEVWDAFREEHYQVVEQLPLSLHRVYALIKELDEHVQDDSARLLQSLKSYISARETISIVAGTPPSFSVPMDLDDPPQQLAAASVAAAAVPFVSQREESLTRPMLVLRTRQSQAVRSPSVQNASHEPSNTRELLTTIAQLSEEVMIAANEKVNLARFACDLIDRQGRDLERAIKEQETSLSVGLRPGTHPASIMLPEVVVPSAIRVPRVVHSPIPDDEGPIQDLPPEPQSEAAVDPDAPPVTEEKPRKKPRGRPPKKKEGSALPKSSSSPQRPVLTVIVPPLPIMVPEPPASEPVEAPTDTDELRYCYCNGVSAGTMIACDGPDCRYQWFHLECLQIEEVPEGDYLCPDCVKAKVKPTRRRKKR